MLFQNNIQKGTEKMKKIVYTKGEVVFREGDMGTCFYQIEEGTAGVYLHYGEAEQRKLTELGPGQYFGEMAVIEAWPRSTTIVAENDLHVIEIPEDDLNIYFDEQPDKILALMKQLSSRIRSLTAEYEEVKAFIEEKKTAGAEKKEGFLARMKKYLEISALANKNAGATKEEVLRQKFFHKDDALPVMTCSKGQIIFREGDEGLLMYAVHGGAVDIFRNYGKADENKLTTLYTNDFFGEMGMIDKEIRSATAVAGEDDTVLECIRAEDLEGLFRSNPVKVDMILSHLSHRLRQLTLDYVEACRKAVGEA